MNSAENVLALIKYKKYKALKSERQELQLAGLKLGNAPQYVNFF